MAFFSMMSGDDSEIPDEEGGARMQEMFGPTAVDNLIRQAISMCWMCLPTEKRSIEEVERQLRRLLDRALQNAKDDGTEFGISESSN